MSKHHELEQMPLHQKAEQIFSSPKSPDFGVLLILVLTY